MGCTRARERYIFSMSSGNLNSVAAGTDVVGLMNNWILKVGRPLHRHPRNSDTRSMQTGYPVLTVIKAPGGISVRQNRFLASGIADPKDDETIWLALDLGSIIQLFLMMFIRTVPLNVLTFDSTTGNPIIDKTIFLSERERFVPLDKSKPFKLNAGSTGFCKLHTRKPLPLLSPSQTAFSTPQTTSIKWLWKRRKGTSATVWDF
jgi:hypothetical protein